MTSKKDKKSVRANVMFTNWMHSAEGGAMLASLGRAVGARSLRCGVLGHAERWPGKKYDEHDEIAIFSASIEYVREWPVG